jgi:hypothetical protein
MVLHRPVELARLTGMWENAPESPCQWPTAPKSVDFGTLDRVNLPVVDSTSWGRARCVVFGTKRRAASFFWRSRPGKRNCSITSDWSRKSGCAQCGEGRSDKRASMPEVRIARDCETRTDPALQPLRPRIRRTSQTGGPAASNGPLFIRRLQNR